MRIDLFVIDGQNDFCASGQEPDDWPTAPNGKRAGTMCVPGADKEAQKVADMIDRLHNNDSPRGHKIAKIHATLDSHHPNDSSHNIVWKTKDGNPPPPFTVVTHQDVKDQKYVPQFTKAVWKGELIPSLEWALKQTEALEKEGRCPLTLWPVHCPIGEWGSMAYYPLQLSYRRWTDKTMGYINWITKGQWPFTEHYSGLRAEIIDPTRPETQFNTEVTEDIGNSDMVIWAGWAGSHCLRWTALDAINSFKDAAPNIFKKSVFLEDASAAVPNPPGGPDFGSWRQEFLDEVAKRGATITTSDQLLVG